MPTETSSPDVPVIWEPIPGSQRAFLDCPTFEVLYSGTRGNGKSECLVVDWLQDCGHGWGENWRGMLFRQEDSQLADLWRIASTIIPRAFPGSVLRESPYKRIVLPSGESLEMRQLKDMKDFAKIQGFNRSWVGIDELSNYPDDRLLKMAMSIVRGGPKGMPRRVRNATNPGGAGHNWVKRRYGLPLLAQRIVGPEIRDGKGTARRVICGYLSENFHLLRNDPEYVNRLRQNAISDAQLRAWVYGDWDITDGGMFDDLWRNEIHRIPNIPFNKIPQGWRLTRSFDWGSAKPFSVGWWLTSNGEPSMVEGRSVGGKAGDRIRLAEWYGAKSNADNLGLNMLNVEIADGIVRREEEWGIRGRVQPGHADSAIFANASGTGKSIADDMKERKVIWIPSDKGPGSRIHGWGQVRKYLKAATVEPREDPGLFVCDRCREFLRIFPTLPRDPKNPDDLNTESEDHVADEARYELYQKPRVVGQSTYR